MEQLKMMKEQLTSIVQGQMGNLQNADAKELGEAVDMIKDLAEAIYYCTVTEAMKENEKEPKGTNNYYYTEKYYPMMSSNNGTNGSNNMGHYRRYYDGSGNNGEGGNRYYTMPMPREHEYEYPMMMDMHDPREGRSPLTRKTYIESKEMHHPKEHQMKELEKYIQELSQDITEMIEDATPEEKQLLQQKIATLATKIR